MTQGAISIVNAVACGKGGTVAVRLPTFARVTMSRKVGGWRLVTNGIELESTLATQSARNAIRIAGRDPDEYSGSIQTATSVPMEVGLKTSSSSSVAIILAVISALHYRDYEDGAVLRASARSSLKAGASLTGALDDAASSLMGGVNFTDNAKREVASTTKLGRSMPVLIRVPNRASRRKQVSLGYVQKFSEAAGSIYSMGLAGRFWKAMTLNGLLYSSIYGYPTDDATLALAIGAIGAGLSGTGPATCAIFDDEEDLERLAANWRGEGVTLIRTETTDSGATIGP